MRRRTILWLVLGIPILCTGIVLVLLVQGNTDPSDAIYNTTAALLGGSFLVFAVLSWLANRGS